jgi:hypothetical protein
MQSIRTTVSGKIKDLRQDVPTRVGSDTHPSTVINVEFEVTGVSESRDD